MGIFVSNVDEIHTLCRTVFNRELGREPSPADLDAWVYYLATGTTVDACLAGTRDSAEAQAFRAKRGW